MSKTIIMPDSGHRSLQSGGGGLANLFNLSCQVHYKVLFSWLVKIGVAADKNKQLFMPCGSDSQSFGVVKVKSCGVAGGGWPRRAC